MGDVDRWGMFIMVYIFLKWIKIILMILNFSLFDDSTPNQSIPFVDLQQIEFTN
jgi:hypothetical protein